MNDMLEMSSAAPKVTKRIKIWLDADLIDWFKPVLSIVEGVKQGGARGPSDRDQRGAAQGGGWGAGEDAVNLVNCRGNSELAPAPKAKP